ncbi:hypothetical protein BZG01_08200 [Labilibaculum manganireducens]|uniref:Uncharacterized protein n=1 Tax=Labilibaculum manganireducens TaxID=1940525 RepID=A0A2N3IAN3_9BACT|nr:hypothetical protein BZG01_08200 [Labilibaculum manganireducens]
MPGNFGKVSVRVEQYHETFMPGNCGTQRKQLKIMNYKLGKSQVSRSFFGKDLTAFFLTCQSRTIS